MKTDYSKNTTGIARVLLLLPYSKAREDLEISSTISICMKDFKSLFPFNIPSYSN